MTRMLLLVLSLGASVTVAFAQPVKYVEIDGSKHPELIPDWVTWETAFGALALVERNGSVAMPASLHVPDADQHLVFEAARGQATRDSTCRECVERLRPLLGKVKDSEINARTRDISSSVAKPRSMPAAS